MRLLPGIATRALAVRLAWAGALVIGIVLVVPLLLYVRQPGPSIVRAGVESFNDGATVAPGALSVTGAFRPNQYGYYLPAHRSGTASYTLVKAPAQGLSLAAYAYLDPVSVPGTITVAYDGGADQAVTVDRHVGRAVLVLPGEARGARVVTFRVTATNRSANDRLVLDQLEWSIYTGRAIAPPSPVAPLGAGLLTAVIAFALIRPAALSSVVALSIGGVTAYGLAARLAQLQAFSMTPLDPDAVVYRIYADRFQWWPLTKGLFCGCYSEREPFFPLVGHLALSILGSTDFHLRVVSLVFSTLAIVLAIAAARRLVGWTLAVTVGAVLASNAPLAFESVRGLRTEVEMCLLLAVFLLLERPVTRSVSTSGVAAGIGSALLALTRTFFVPVIGVATIVACLAWTRSFRRAVLPIAIALLIPAAAVIGHRVALYEVPHKVNYAALHDFQFDTAGYNRWNANVEKFDQGRPLPHPELFPTLAQYQRDGPYAGPPLSTYQYLFVVHTPQEVFHDTLAGYVDIWRNTDGFTWPIRSLRPLDGAVDSLVRWLGLAGLVGLILTARRQPIRLLIPAMIVSALAFAAFAYHRELTERYRHTIQGYPLFLAGGAWVLEAGVRVVWAELRRRDWRTALLEPRLRPWVLAGLAALSALLIVRTATAGAMLVVLALVTIALAGSAALLDVAAGVAAVLAVSAVAGPRVGAAATVGAAAAVVLPRWRAARHLLLVGAAPAMYALSLLVAGAGVPGWHPSRAALLMAGVTFAATGLGAVGARAEVPARFLGAYAGTAALAAVAALITGGAGGAPILFGGALVAVTAPAVPIAAWLSSRRRDWLWPSVAILATVVTTAALPLVGAVAAIAAMTVAPLRSRAGGRPLVWVVGLALLVGLVVAAIQPAVVRPSWRTYLAARDVALQQTFASVPAGTDRLFIYCRRASADPAYHATLEVDGRVLTTRLDSQMAVAAASWIAVPVPGGDPHQVTIRVTGTPDAGTRYIEVGGVYGSPAALRGDLLIGGRGARPDLSLDAGYQQGTLLILPGTARGPYDYGLRLPSYTVRSPLDIPPSIPRAGEEHASPAALAESGTRRLATAGLELFRSRPVFGSGVGSVASAFSAASLGDGLTARTQPVQSLAEQGLLGLMALLLAASAVVVAVLRSPEARLERSLIAATMLAVLLLEAPLAAVLSATAWWLLFGWLVAGARRPSPEG